MKRQEQRERASLSRCALDPDLTAEELGDLPADRQSEPCPVRHPLELTVHLRRPPGPGWLQAAIRSRALLGGLIEEDAEVWDEDGRLVAMSRQLAQVVPDPRPRNPTSGKPPC